MTTSKRSSAAVCGSFRMPRSSMISAGADPTGWGAIVAGYGDQRGVELLVRSGFTPEQAIQIASSNGAHFLGDRTVGRIAAGMQADPVVLRGNPTREISDVRNVETVFKV